MKVLIMDNYDSFTFNLYQSVGEILSARAGGCVLDVRRNDELTLEEIARAEYDRIIISPGPGSPDEPRYFGACGRVIKELGPTVPVLGVCLGMQGIAYCFGGKIIRAVLPKHGKTSVIFHNQKDIFAGLPQGLEAMRYHSLVVERNGLPDVLEITAETADPGGNQEIMGLRHKQFPIFGVQFHPESFATEGGKKILTNFLYDGAD